MYYLLKPEPKRRRPTFPAFSIRIARKNTRVITCAENSDTTAPRKNVNANPFTIELPNQNKITDTIIAAI
jgi:hypothetical protein